MLIQAAWVLQDGAMAAFLLIIQLQQQHVLKLHASGAGSALQLSMYGVDEYVTQYETELGRPWKNPDKWIKLSYPFFHADKIKTPTLFMASQKDFNVPSVGAEQMYQALRSTWRANRACYLSRTIS